MLTAHVSQQAEQLGNSALAAAFLTFSKDDCVLFGAGVLVLLFVVAAGSYRDGYGEGRRDSRRRATRKDCAHE